MRPPTDTNLVEVIAIDPGTHQSATVCVDATGAPLEHHNRADNDAVLSFLRRTSPIAAAADVTLVIEMVASYGMPVGREVFETVAWIGRFMEAWQPAPVVRVERRHVKMHLCGSNRAKDSNIRQALLDRFGPGRQLAIGKKASPGPCYGIARDGWAALALAVTYVDGAAEPYELETPE